MMKRLLPFLLLLLPFLAVGQDLPIDKETGKISYTGSIEATGKLKAALYNSARLWMVKEFAISANPIQVDDKEEGILIGRTYTEFQGSKSRYRYWYTAKIEVKEGVLTFEFTDIELEGITALNSGKQSLGKWPAENTLVKPTSKNKKGVYYPENQKIFDATKDIIPSLVIGLTKQLGISTNN